MVYTNSLKNTHAILSPSSYSWLNYDEEKLVSFYKAQSARIIGTRIHAFAEEAIRLKIRLPDTTASLNAFVNDAIGYRMDPEVLLYWSAYCYGTADALYGTDTVLRISDLKTGVSKASMDQLRIYAALYCLERNLHPNNIDIHLSIYQNDEVNYENAKATDIIVIMDKIKYFSEILEALEDEYERYK